ncbi:DUF3576 domain-containing protein [Thalassovita sp.]|jgi:hypothetical protein|uniref:DUF3576 domain-containing protein n=1 Tax=Thalassovita sp. TaxID=1979401 RepID=UPI003B5A25D3
MARMSIKPISIALIAALAVAGCSRGSDNAAQPDNRRADDLDPVLQSELARQAGLNQNQSSITDLFKPRNNDLEVAVNRYIWNAALEILNFLPVQSVDPYTGVIVTGYGTPPGGGRSYRATVYVKDPALEARSLLVALQTSGGKPVSASTQRAIEDAILTRARQLRIADKGF